MSRGVVPWVLLALAALSMPAAAAPTQTTVLVSTPVFFSGDLDAATQDGQILYGSASSLEMSLTAKRAYLHVTNVTRDRSDVPNPAGPEGATQPPDVLRDLELRLRDPTPNFRLHAFNRGLDDGSYRYVPAPGSDGQADSVLSVIREPVHVRTPGESLLGHNETIAPGTYHLWSDRGAARVEGNFTVFFFGVTLVVADASGATEVRTGTWTEETRPLEGQLGDLLPVLWRTEVTQYVVLELEDAVLEARDSGDLLGFYAGGDAPLSIDLDGTLTAPGASGGVGLDDEVVVTHGERVSMSGSMQVLALDAFAESGDALLSVEGDVSSAIIGGTQYDWMPMALGASLAALAAAALAWFWPAIKMGGLVPLYAKLSKDRLLDQGTRQQVFTKVEQDPGVKVKQVAVALDVSWTTAAYHLRVLRKMGLVTSTRQGRYEHFFVAGSQNAAARAALSLLQNGTTRRVLATVLKEPGIIQKDLCARIGVVPSTAHWHIRRLKDAGLVREDREWKLHRYYAGEKAAGLEISIA